MGLTQVMQPQLGIHSHAIPRIRHMRMLDWSLHC